VTWRIVLRSPCPASLCLVWIRKYLDKAGVLRTVTFRESMRRLACPSDPVVAVAFRDMMCARDGVTVTIHKSLRAFCLGNYKHEGANIGT
jgi:hypothetical protein